MNADYYERLRQEQLYQEEESKRQRYLNEIHEK